MRALLGGALALVRVDSQRHLRATTCPATKPPVSAAVPEGLPEASGLALSLQEPGRLYSMNDTPEPAGPHLFAFGTDGVVDLAVTLDLGKSKHAFGKTGVGDWEGLAVGPCQVGGAASCVFIGDTGHNCAREDCPYKRDWYRIIAVPEESVRGQEAVPVKQTWFQFPDHAAYDAEALLVHPTGAMFVLTKDNAGEARIFSYSSCDGAVEQVGAISLPGYMITGGSIDPQGNRLMLRMYKAGGQPKDEASGRLLFWRLPAVPRGSGKSCGEAAKRAASAAVAAVVKTLASPGCELPTAPEPQGEGCAFLPGDPPAGYATLSEQGAPLHVVRFSAAAVVLALWP